MTLPDGQEPEAKPEPGAEQAADAAASTPEAAATTPEAAGEAPKAEKPAAAAKAERPARPAKEPEPKTAPRVAPPAGSVNEAVAAASGVTLGAAYLVPDWKGESVAVEVSRDDVPAVLTACRDDERLDMKLLRCLSGVDWQEEGLEVVYHLYSLSKKRGVTVKTRVSYDDANVPSVAGVYPAAEWHEREARDMFGINFTGHPDLRPLLLPEDMTDHFPLRKDNPLQEIEEWQGENLREGAGEEEE
ncbi:MAG: NADH-quinone oxidoreductase subunit C [Chloroflexi bacterium]|nr:NADH-quinone oxidoreductase subunit C [Chloroflexota bacterium]